MKILFERKRVVVAKTDRWAFRTKVLASAMRIIRFGPLVIGYYLKRRKK